MNYDFSYDEILQQVLAFMHSLNISPHDERDLKFDGTLHRYRTRYDKHGQKSGAYCIYTDGLPAGFVMDWHGTKENWKFDIGSLPDEQKKYFNSDEYRKKQQEAHDKREKERAQKQLQASEKARILFEHLPPAPDNFSYLINKNVPNFGLHFFSDAKSIAVPLHDIKGIVRSLQWIDEQGNKKFFPGASLDGAFFSIALDTMHDNPSQIIFIGEGYATVAKIYELTSCPVIAAITCTALKSIAKIIRKQFPQAKIIIAADNDKATELKRGFNPGIDAANDAVNSGAAIGFIAPDFDNPDDGSDWDDFALHFGDEKTTRVLRNKVNYELTPKNIKDLLPHIEEINAQDLRYKVFAPIKWAVQGFLPSGCSILGGGPKVGKSILALHLSLGVAIGGCVLGKIDVEQGEVLYLALEDTQRRLQERIEGASLPDDCDLSRLSLITRIPRQHEGGIEYIKWWLGVHKHARLVIIDTLQKFRKQLSSKGNVYGEDYDVVSDIKALADEFDVAFLLIHHLKKAKDTDDWLNEFSGSQGLTGAADTLFSLKRARTQNGGILHRTGRDVEEKDFAMRLDGYGWSIEGEAELFTVPEWERQITDYLKEHNSVTPILLSEAYNLPLNTAQQNLRRLEKKGGIKKIGYGTYALEGTE